MEGVGKGRDGGREEGEREGGREGGGEREREDGGRREGKTEGGRMVGRGREKGAWVYYRRRNTNLLQDVFAGSSQDNSASLGLRAVHEVSEILVPNLADLKETTLDPNITLLQLVSTVTDSGTTGPGREGGGRGG